MTPSDPKAASKFEDFDIPADGECGDTLEAWLRRHKDPKERYRMGDLLRESTIDLAKRTIADKPRPGLQPVYVEGRTYYVDADPKVGHDELNDGSRERPFRTVERAIEEAGP